MSYGFLDIAITPSVEAAQAQNASAHLWQNFKGDRAFDRFTDNEAAFIAERDSFYMASVSETGWPYVQHRGGPRGFLRMIDDRTLAFADFAGNRQYISLGNLAADARVSLILVDYANRRRLKIFAHARSEEPRRRSRSWRRRSRRPAIAAGRNAHSCSISTRSTGIARSTSRRASMRRTWRRPSESCSNASRNWKRRTCG